MIIAKEPYPPMVITQLPWLRSVPEETLPRMQERELPPESRRMYRSLVVVAAAVSLLSCAQAAGAQASTGSDPAPRVHTMTFAPPPPGQGVDLGFGYAMDPGPHNEYTYSYVVVVDPGSAAARAGLVVGDTILASDGNDARSGAFFPEPRTGKRYVLRLRRNGEEREVIYVYPAPPPAAAPASGSKPPR